MKLRELFESPKDNNVFDNSLKTVGVCFGRFNPPHHGHREVWKAASANPFWYVGTNKDTSGPKDPLPYDIKLQCMALVWPKVAEHVIPEQSLLTLASKIYSLLGDGMTIAYITDDTDWAWAGKLLLQYNGKKSLHGYFNFKNIIQVSSNIDWFHAISIANTSNKLSQNSFIIIILTIRHLTYFHKKSTTCCDAL